MIRRRPTAAWRLAAGTALAAPLVVLLTVPAPAAVAADRTTNPVTIVLDSLTPLVPTADGTLRIQGRVINTSEDPLSSVSVQLRRAAAPLTDRADVAAISDLELEPSGGDPDSVAVPTSRVLVADELRPGARRQFELAVPFATLGLGDAGVYVVGLEALGLESGVDEFEERKGEVRTFVPWFPDPQSVTPVSLVWLWPLADWPDRSASGVLLSERTPEELSSGGRLDRLLTIGERTGGTVSWIIDPALVQTASDMKDGYEVARGDGTALGGADRQAAEWLNRVTAVIKSGGGRSLPYADNDASAATRAGMSNDVVRAVTQGPGVAAAALGTPVPGSLYWAPFGRLDAPTADVLASAGVTTLVLSATAMPPLDPAAAPVGQSVASLPTSTGAIRTVLADPGLTAVLGLPQGDADEVILARQRFLAETGIAASAPTVDDAPRTLVVAPASVRWDATASLVSPLLKATRSAPWLDPMSLERLIEGPRASVNRERAGYGAKAREAELSPSYMAQVAAVTDQLNSFTSIIDDPTGVAEPYSAALLRAQSSAWRSEPREGERLLASIAGELDDEMGQVRVLSEGTITFSGDRGRVPITITNDLDRDVTVGVTLIGEPALRMQAEPLTDIPVEAGRMASVDIEARVVGGDPLTVRVQLLGPDGSSYGEGSEIQVTSTAYSRTAAWVVALAFGAIVVFVIFGVTRRIRAAARTPTARAPEPDPAPHDPVAQ